MENFGKFCFALLAIVLTSIYGGFVFSKLWLWIIVPITQLRTLSVYESVGIMFFVGCFIKVTQKEEESSSKGWEKFVELILKAIVMYSMYLLIGYIYYLLR